MLRASIRTVSRSAACRVTTSRPRSVRLALEPPPRTLLRLSKSTIRSLSSTSTRLGQIKEFKLADIGEGITECEIVKWLVKPGDVISEFDPVAEVQSDKASVEITSPYSGTIRSIAGNVGDMLKVGATLCQVELEASEETSASASSSSATPTERQHSPSSPSGTAETKQFKLADIGEGITECQVVKWLVKPGDSIEEFDPIVEVTSDKASVEITSPFSGTIKSLAGEVGDMLKVGATLCEIEVVSSSPPEPGQVESLSSQTEEVAQVPHPVRPDPQLGSASVLATPATRRFARELKVDLTKVTPTGRDGRVTKGDVLDFSKKTAESPPFVPFERPPIDTPKPSTSTITQPSTTSPSLLASSSSTPDEIPLSTARRAMFRAMSASLQIPHFAYSDTIDVTLLERLRISLNSNIPLQYRKTLTAKDELALERTRQWQAQTETIDPAARLDRITLLPLLLKALSTAIDSNPLFTCTLSTSSGAEPLLVRRPSHNISVAVSSPNPAGGLFTPVLRSVDSQSIFSIASNLTHLQSFLTPTSTLPKFPSQYQGSGSITLSNIGAIGGRTTHPVIPPTGQLAIGAMGRVRVEPRFAKGTEEERAKRVARGELELQDVILDNWKIEPRLVMDVTFSADHRVVEGVELARLVETWKEIIEDPTRLLV
ncbi:uncharacterized protein JCM15063_005452 [Sporobolomyces koalae]|uniref:uncharacterized protein n=1 Tax=Sporobolomyces koalae TaxID=500713 RepID=UPI0031740872